MTGRWHNPSTMKNALIYAAVASSLATAVHAATPAPAPVPEQLLACSKLQDESARVRCYDEQIAAMNAAVAAAPKASAPAAAATAPPAPAGSAASAGTTAPAARTAPAALSSGPAPQAGTAKEFGQEMLPPTAREKRPESEAALVSTITDVHALGQSIYLISLANGQVWRQEGSSVTAFFRSGSEVKIEKAMLGSYQMSTPQTGTKNWVRVTRVR